MNKTLNSAGYVNLTTWLKAQRLAKDLSMRELAERMGISHSFIGKIEQRERRLDVIEYMEYCDALGVKWIDGLKVVERSN